MNTLNGIIKEIKHEVENHDIAEIAYSRFELYATNYISKIVTQKQKMILDENFEYALPLILDCYNLLSIMVSSGFDYDYIEGSIQETLFNGVGVYINLITILTDIQEMTITVDGLNNGGLKECYQNLINLQKEKLSQNYKVDFDSLEDVDLVDDFEDGLVKVLEELDYVN